jgi:hypothetical protein
MRKRPSGVRLFGAGTLVAALAACAPSSQDIATSIMSDPLKYQYYDCKQMADVMKSLTAQEQKLEDLIRRAEQDTGGAFVAAVAYKNDYVKVRADKKVLRDTQVRRDCIKQTEQGGIGAVH